jgi:hypothetical protein
MAATDNPGAAEAYRTSMALTENAATPASSSG